MQWRASAQKRRNLLSRTLLPTLVVWQVQTSGRCNALLSRPISRLPMSQLPGMHRTTALLNRASKQRSRLPSRLRRASQVLLSMPRKNFVECGRGQMKNPAACAKQSMPRSKGSKQTCKSALQLAGRKWSASAIARGNQCSCALPAASLACRLIQTLLLLPWRMQRRKKASMKMTRRHGPL